MTDTIIKMLNERFPMKEVANPDFCTMKLSGMNFVIKAYDAKGLGRVSVMKAKGFFGLMKMDTLMINPFEIDMPLMSYDRVLAMGNDTLIFELYDTFIKRGDIVLPNYLKTLSNTRHLPDPIKRAIVDLASGKDVSGKDFEAYCKDYIKWLDIQTDKLLNQKIR